MCLNLQKIDFFLQLALQVVPIHFKVQRVCLCMTEKSPKISESIWCFYRSLIIYKKSTSHPIHSSYIVHSVLGINLGATSSMFSHVLPHPYKRTYKHTHGLNRKLISKGKNAIKLKGDLLLCEALKNCCQFKYQTGNCGNGRKLGIWSHLQMENFVFLISEICLTWINPNLKCLLI